MFLETKHNQGLYCLQVGLQLLVTCPDPEGGTGGPDPPWNLKILPKKKVISGFFGCWTPPRL